MKLRHVFLANAVISLVLGGAVVIAAPQLTSWFGVEIRLTQPGVFAVSRLFGGAILGYGVLTLLARNTPDSPARRAIVLALFITHALGFVIALPAQLSGVVNALGWIIVAFYLVLALGYGYFQFVKPGTA